MRILITGGLGYLGGRLAQHLAQNGGDEIVLGSRREEGPPPWLAGGRVVATPWQSLAGLVGACAGVEVVVHLAGMTAQACGEDPVGALEANAVATERLLRAAIQQRVQRFVYLSTAHVYGSPLAGVITETTCPDPVHPYATSNRAGEDAVRSAQRRGEIEGLVVRLSNAYGPPAHKDAGCWTLLVNDLCRQAVTTGRMALRSSGLQRRDLIPLTGACRAIHHLVDVPVSALGGGVFNVGGEWSPTVWEVAELVQQRCGPLLGSIPALSRVPQVESEEPGPALDYRLDALRQSGYHPDADKETEIDGLLTSCRAWFG